MPVKESSSMADPPSATPPSNRPDRKKHLHVLIVEDNPADAALAEEMLKEDKSAAYEIVSTNRIVQAKAALAASSFDVVLLDLSLPDAHSLQGLELLLVEKPSQAIVVLTGQEDEALGLSAIHEGAQDYLAKGRLTADLLVRSLRYAMERSALQLRLEMANLQRLREQEITALNSIAEETSIGATKRHFKSRSLKEVAPKVFREFVGEYEGVFGKAIAEQVYKVPSSAAEQLRQLADRLCRYRVGPKDVIDIHLAMLERKVALESLSNRQIVGLTNEARVVLLQILGFVAEGYRAYAMSFGGGSEGENGEQVDK